MLKETLIVIPSPIHNIPLAITDEAFLFYLELPFPFFCVLCFFLVKQDCYDQAVINHDGEESCKELSDVSNLQIIKIILVYIIFV